MDVLHLSTTDMRQVLRLLAKQHRDKHPLLSAELVTRRLQEMGYPDTVEHRWWALGTLLDGVILAEINAAIGPGAAIRRDDLRRIPPGDRARWLLDHARDGKAPDAESWFALYARYIVATPASYDLPTVAGVHARTWQRWLKEGYGALRQRLHDLEAEAAPVGSGESAGASVGAPPSPTGRLPMVRERMIGRADELAAILARLERRDTWLVTLTGPGGVGKTRLAQAVGEAFGRLPGHSVAYVALSALQAPDEVLWAIARELGISPDTRHGIVKGIAAALNRPAFLLILDGFDPVVAAGPDLTELAQVCPDIKLLVTSREVLQLYGEHVFSVPPLAIPTASDVAAVGHQTIGDDWLARFPAIGLFVERARATRHDFAATAAELPWIAATCARLDGLPLAIELAARQTDVLGSRALAGRSIRDLDRFVAGPRANGDDHESIHAVLASSYRLLDPTEQAAFRRSAVFAGGFTVPEAETVWRAAGGMDGVDAWAVIRGLSRKSLVQTCRNAEDEPRFFLLDTVRHYGLALLAEAGDDGPTWRAHAERCCAELSQWAVGRLRGPEATGALRRLDLGNDNFMLALAWCFDHDAADLGARLAIGMAEYWDLRGRIVEANRWLDRALMTDLKTSDLELYYRVLSVAARFRALAGRNAEARVAGEACLAAAEELGDDRLVAAASGNLGIQAMQTGDYTRAFEYLRRAMTGYLALGEPSLAARGMFNLAICACYQDDPRAAETWGREALMAYARIGDEIGVGRSLEVLGRLAAEAGDRPAAVDLFSRALAIARAHGTMLQSLPPLAGLAGIALAHGSRIDAAAHWRECLAVCRTEGRSAHAAQVLFSIAEALGLPWTRGPFALEADTAGAPWVVEPPRARWRSAVRLMAASTAILDATGHVLTPATARRCSDNVAALADALGAFAFDMAWAEGLVLSTDGLFAEAEAGMQALVSDGPRGAFAEVNAPRSAPQLLPFLVGAQGATWQRVERAEISRANLRSSARAEQEATAPWADDAASAPPPIEWARSYDLCAGSEPAGTA